MTSFLDKNGLQRYHNDIKGGLNEVKIQDDEPTSGKIWFDTDGQILIDPNDFDAEKQEVVVSNILPEADDHHKLWVNPDKGASPEDFIQSDWNSNDEASASYIRNKPIVNNTYSTSEQVVGTWVDGKPIYRKVIIVSRQFNTGNTKLNHNISNFGTLIDIKGSWTGSAEKFPIIDVTPSALTYSMSITGISSTQINVNTASGNAGTWTMNLILEYTKTTD